MQAHAAHSTHSPQHVKMTTAHLSCPTGMYPSLAPTSSVITMYIAASPTHAMMLLHLRSSDQGVGQAFFGPRVWAMDTSAALGEPGVLY